ncbi:MAG TPA: type II toxin-antitoxin system VapC family toxin [Thermoplasmata archaeon]|nr:type II toxin-antitoxin system VapC family toxin [Thermoplasmata archaeon]
MILIDSSAWYALADNRERHHGDAVRLFARVTKGEFGRILTTDYVLDETYTLLRMRLGIGPVRALRDLLTGSSNLQMVRVSERDFDHAVELMLNQADKRWSLTDCTSFVLMRELEISRAFTFDHNFSEAGFQVLPAQNP